MRTTQEVPRHKRDTWYRGTAFPTSVAVNGTWKGKAFSNYSTVCCCFIVTGFQEELKHIMLPFKRLRGESTSPSKLESNICALCEKSVADCESLECAWCEQLQHRSCVKMSDDQYCVLVNHPTNLVYFCTPCTHKLPSALATLDIVDEVNTIVNKALKSLELNLTNKLKWTL